MAIYWLLSGRVRFEHSLSWGLVGNALYLVFFLCISSGAGSEDPKCDGLSDLSTCSELIFQSHHSPQLGFCSPALCFPQQQPSVWVSCCPQPDQELSENEGQVLLILASSGAPARLSVSDSEGAQ